MSIPFLKLIVYIWRRAGIIASSCHYKMVMHPKQDFLHSPLGHDSLRTHLCDTQHKTGVLGHKACFTMHRT
jgi:hypothetical protein